MPSRIVFILGSFFGAGCAPRLRGTIGTAIPAGCIAAVEAIWSPVWWWSAVAAVAVLAVGTPLASLAERGEEKDPDWFVLDEVFGLLVTVTGLAPLTGVDPVRAVIPAFIVFRAFDILKPPPVRFFERRPGGGLSVMLDDGVAAIYAWVVSSGLLLVLS